MTLSVISKSKMARKVENECIKNKVRGTLVKYLFTSDDGCQEIHVCKIEKKIISVVKRHSSFQIIAIVIPTSFSFRCLCLVSRNKFF